MPTPTFPIVVRHPQRGDIASAEALVERLGRAILARNTRQRVLIAHDARQTRDIGPDYAQIFAVRDRIVPIPVIGSVWIVPDLGTRVMVRSAARIAAHPWILAGTLNEATEVAAALDVDREAWILGLDRPLVLRHDAAAPRVHLALAV